MSNTLMNLYNSVRPLSKSRPSIDTARSFRQLAMMIAGRSSPELFGRLKTFERRISEFGSTTKLISVSLVRLDSKRAGKALLVQVMAWMWVECSENVLIIAAGDVK